MGVLSNGWFIVYRENAIYKWMMTRSTPILGTVQIFVLGNMMGINHWNVYVRMIIRIYPSNVLFLCFQHDDY